MERSILQAAKLEGKYHRRLLTLDMELLDLGLVFAVFRSCFGPVYFLNIPHSFLYFKMSMNIQCCVL